MTKQIKVTPEVALTASETTKIKDLVFNGTKLSDFVKRIEHKGENDVVRPTLLIGSTEWKPGKGGNGTILQGVWPNSLGNACIALFGNRYSEITEARHLRVFESGRINTNLAAAVNNGTRWVAYDRSGGILIPHRWKISDGKDAPDAFSQKHAALWSVYLAVMTNQVIVYSLTQNTLESWKFSFEDRLDMTVKEYNEWHGTNWNSAKVYQSAVTQATAKPEPVVLVVDGVDLSKVTVPTQIWIEGKNLAMVRTIFPSAAPEVLQAVDTMIKNGAKASLVK